MLLLFASIGALVAGFSEILAMTAPGALSKKLEWPDYVVLIVPPVALELMILSFVFLPPSVAIVLSLVLVVALLWSVITLLKLPTRKRSG